MIGNRKLIVDANCDVHNNIDPYVDYEFCNLQQDAVISNAIYLIGREQFVSNMPWLKEVANNNDTVKIILSNPSEGSDTLKKHCNMFNITQLVLDRKILLIGGGDMEESYPCLQYDSFLPKILDYNENINAVQTYNNNYSIERPYKFLFLNGLHRDHRKYMITALSGLLDTALWSNLDAGNGPIKLLDKQYENKKFDVDFPVTDNNVKSKLFGPGIWGEIYLDARPYSDTYFSLVTETVFDYPYSFRTEKIWKPIAIGHPWIAVANYGYYRDMHNLGFQTFRHVIDESFDLIENNQDRLERVSQLVKDLCQQDLASFLKECYNVCKYNQQHLAEMQIKVRAEFPERFRQFVTKHINE